MAKFEQGMFGGEINTILITFGGRGHSYSVHYDQHLRNVDTVVQLIDKAKSESGTVRIWYPPPKVILYAKMMAKQ